MTFGEQLRNIRESRGLSVNQLAVRSGISAAQISRLENNLRGLPKPETIQKLAHSLSYDYHDLMRMTGYLQNESTESNNPYHALSEQELVLLVFYRSLTHELRERLLDMDIQQWIIASLKLMENKKSNDDSLLRK